MEISFIYSFFFSGLFAVFANLYYRALSKTNENRAKRRIATLVLFLYLLAMEPFMNDASNVNIGFSMTIIFVVYLIGLVIFWGTIFILDKKRPITVDLISAYVLTASICVLTVFMSQIVIDYFVYGNSIDNVVNVTVWDFIGIAIGIATNILFYKYIKSRMLTITNS